MALSSRVMVSDAHTTPGQSGDAPPLESSDGPSEDSGVSGSEGIPAGSSGPEETTVDRIPPDTAETTACSLVRDARRRTRLRRWTEVAVVVPGAMLLAVGMTWPQIHRMDRTAPGDLGDPLLIGSQLAWVGHALWTHPSALWTSPAYLQAKDNVAFTDTTFGYAPLQPLTGGGVSGALVMLNLATMLTYVIAFIGAYALARALGARIPGALVAGGGFAYAPWHLEQITHLNVVSTGGIALSLALLLRGHAWSLRHGWRPERMSPAVVFCGWLVACWQLSLGFAIGIPFGYALGLVMALLLLGWAVRSRRRLPRRLVTADAAGVVLFGLLVWVMARPYLWVVKEHPEGKRDAGLLPLFSPPWRGLLTAPSRSYWWGHLAAGWRSHLGWTPEMVLLPGFLLIGLAVAGLAFSTWTLRRRLLLGLATAVAVILAMGTAFPGDGHYTYLPVYHALPGWDAMRTPGRLIVWVTLGLSLLAAGFVSRIAGPVWERVRPRRRPRTASPRGRVRFVLAAAGALLLVVPGAAVTAEGYGRVPNWDVERAPFSMSSLAAPILVLPTQPLGDYHVMLWDADGWPVIANGDSGFDALMQRQLRKDVAGFPDAASVQALRVRGVRTVVVMRSWVGGTPWETAVDRPVDGLSISRTDLGNAVIYGL